MARFVASGARRLPVVSLSLAMVAVVLWLVPGAGEAFELQPAGLSRGEGWRMLSGHFTHWSLDHLVWDAGVLLLLGAACEARGRARFALVVGLSCVAIAAGLAVWAPGLHRYRGLSGIDAALFSWMAVVTLREHWRARDLGAFAVALALVLGFAAKVAFETTAGATLFVDSASAGMVPVPLAHVLGGLVGLLAAAATVRDGTMPRPAPDGSRRGYAGTP